MAAPKRKSPRKKTVRKEPGLLSVAVRALGQQILSHPKLVGGSTAFLVVFGFVAANALWYQPGHHPSPFLRTRDEEDPNGIAGYRMTSTLGQHGNVTTFRIERQTDVPEPTQQTAAQPPAGQGGAAVPPVRHSRPAPIRHPNSSQKSSGNSRAAASTMVRPMV